MAGMKACDTCRAAGRPYIKPRVCVVRECVAARKGPELLRLTHEPPTPMPLALTAPAEPLAQPGTAATTS